MSGEINVLSRTQVINVEPRSGAVSVVNAGPPGPGLSWRPWINWPNPRFGDFDLDDMASGLIEATLDGNVTKWGRYRTRGTEEIQYEAAIAIQDPGPGDPSITPPSPGTFGMEAVMVELPFPRIENVIDDETTFGLAQTFASIPPAFGGYGEMYLGVEGSPAVYQASGLITPVYDTGSWADADEPGGETWRRLVAPFSEYDNGFWSWSSNSVVQESLTNPSFWSWRGTYLADLSADVSGGDGPM
jgi:hypothetical protein